MSEDPFFHPRAIVEGWRDKNIGGWTARAIVPPQGGCPHLPEANQGGQRLSLWKKQATLLTPAQEQRCDIDTSYCMDEP